MASDGGENSNSERELKAALLFHTVLTSTTLTSWERRQKLLLRRTQRGTVQSDSDCLPKQTESPTIVRQICPRMYDLFKTQHNTQKKDSMLYTMQRYGLSVRGGRSHNSA